jgi:hypothetical protein
VPGLFDPLELQRLYPERIVRLVDGGVHDNQGISGLLEQECAVVMVSDASGQMNTLKRPSAEAYSVPMRSNNILMARVRQAEFRELDRMRRSSALSGLAFLHRKKDIEPAYVDWVGCQDEYAAFEEYGDARSGYSLTSYGVPKPLQERLAGLRTDLDAFSDLEAYALMLSGYRMADVELERALPALGSPEYRAQEAWRFLTVEQTVDGPVESPAHQKLLRVLRVGANRSFKAWRLRPALALAVATVVVALAVYGLVRGLEWFARVQANGLEVLLVETARAIAPGLGAATAATALLIAALLVVRKLSGGRKTFTMLFSGLVIVTVGAWFGWLYRSLADPLYLSAGRVKRDVRPSNPHRVRQRRVG